MSQQPRLGVAMIGYGFMGAAHSQGWRVAPRFFDLAADPVMDVVVGRNAEAVAAAAEKWGWQESATDWREVIARDDIQIVDIVTPGDSHAEIAIAALEAGKHVLCEKPLANTVEEAEAMAAAAEKAAAKGVKSMLGHTYRRVPATTLARDMVREGKVGEIHQVRAVYLQDWLVDPTVPLAWRLQKHLAGSGALGDIGAHIIDLTQYITGQKLQTVSGTIETIIKERPILEILVRARRQGRRGARRGDGRRCRAVHRPLRDRRAGHVRGDPVRDRPQERAPRRGVRLEGRDRVRPRAAQRAASSTTSPARPPSRASRRIYVTEPRASVHLRLVAGRPHARLRARLLAPGQGLRRRDHVEHRA